MTNTESVYEKRQVQHASWLEYHEADIKWLKKQVKQQADAQVLTWLVIICLFIAVIAQEFR